MRHNARKSDHIQYFDTNKGRRRAAKRERLVPLRRTLELSLLDVTSERIGITRVK